MPKDLQEAGMQDYRKIATWQKSHALALSVYSITKTFPDSELFGLTSQMRRASVSVPANIAEGRFRGGDREFARYLRVALGSAAELEYYVLLATDLSLLQEADSVRLTNAVSEVKNVDGTSSNIKTIIGHSSHSLKAES